MTQRQNVLRHLLAGPLCGVHDDWELGRRIAARIHELRHVGFGILKRTCDQNHNHRGNQIEYVLDRSSPWFGNVVDWCAHCGWDGLLRVNTIEPDSQRLVMQCDRCGKKDYR